MLLLLAYLLKGQESILETSVNEPPVVCMLANWKWTMRGSREIIPPQFSLLQITPRGRPSLPIE